MKDDYSYLYAAAFYKFIKRSKINIEKIIKILKNISEIFDKEKKIFIFLNHPCIRFNDKLKTIKLITVDGITNSLITILVHTGRLKDLKNIIKHLESIADFSDDFINIKLFSAFDLNKKELNILRNALEKFTKKNVFINNIKDPGLIGGLSVKIGDLIIDYSVKKELLLLKESLI